MIDSKDIQGQVVGRDGKVMILFSRFDDGELKSAVTDNLMLDPPAAIAAAEMLTAMAFEMDTNLKPVGETLKATLVEKHRERLLPLLASVVRSMIDQKKSPGQIAVACLDEMCGEVF